MSSAESTALLTMHVIRSERVTTNMVRVTIGGGDVADFDYQGKDHWFRLFLPVAGDESLARVPSKLTRLSYLKFLTVSASERPILRNYTARDYRSDGADGAEIDIDFVVHGTADDGTAGPATLWAQNCQVGDTVGVLDEGAVFAPDDSIRSFRLVADETALPAIIGVLAALPEDSSGQAWIEIPSADDKQQLQHPPGVTVTWIPRDQPGLSPGQLVLAAVQDAEAPTERTYGWVAGEQTLASGARRVWVKQGIDKSDISFTGYYRVGKAH